MSVKKPDPTPDEAAAAPTIDTPAADAAALPEVAPGPSADAPDARRFRINHSMVGPWREGTIVKAALLGDANIARLLETGAISPED